MRLFAAVFLAASLVPGALIAIVYWHERDRDRLLHEQSANYAIDELRGIIEREMAAVVSDLSFLANQPHLPEFLEGSALAKGALTEQFLLFSEYRGIYDQVRYLNREGQEVIRVNLVDGKARVVPAAHLQPKGDRYYVEAALQLGQGEVFVSPMDLNIEGGEIERPLKPVIRFATPIFDQAGELRGIVVLNYLARHLLDKVRQLSDQYPGDLFLVSEAGDYLAGPTRESEWGSELGHARSFSSDYPAAWSPSQRTGERKYFNYDGLMRVGSVPLLAAPSDVRSAADPQIKPARNPQGRNRAGASRLLLVSRIPADVLYQRSGRLLRTQLAVGAAALFVIALLAFHVSRSVIHRRAQAEQIRNSEARLRKLSLELIHAQEEERQRLARDLHDDLGQIATAIRLNLEQGRPQAGPNSASDSIAAAAENTRTLMDRIRALATGLRPPALDDLDVKDAVKSCLGDFERSFGIDVHGEITVEHDIPKEIRGQVYRILQEALRNVSLHADTSQAWVTLICRSNELTLEIRDEGVGFSPDANRHGLGLLTMQERTELLNGSFRIETQPGAGTKVSVCIPLAAEATPAPG